jgi:Asp-tRNA(Asn)/Glu-tRNA(Gln) amidotransferase A subunit family amidase
MTKHGVADDCDPDALPPVSKLHVGVFRSPGILCDDVPVQGEVQAALDAAISAIRPLVAEVREAKLSSPNSLGRLIDTEAYIFHAPYLAQTPERYDPRTRKPSLLAEGSQRAVRSRRFVTWLPA